MKLPAWITTAVAAVSAAFLPACDGINLRELRPGASTAAEVRARMGAPTAEHRNDDGSVTWEYSRQPNGIECHMLTIGADQVLQKIEQALSEASLAAVRAGQSRDDVRRRLGKPAQINVFSNSAEEVWDWRVAGTTPLEEAHFHVHFDTGSGVVKRTSRRVEMRGG
jgi:outer membrane protein assembly factor BamE (lipoprotein component of BamABCDE complex)